MRNERLAPLLHYIISKVPSAELGAVKLNKVAWFADREAYIKFGRTISGRDYIKLERGPVPKGVRTDIEELKRLGKISEQKTTVVDYTRREFVSLNEPDMSAFTDQEIQLIDAVINFVKPKTAAEISEISHDEVWEECEMGELISMKKAAAAAFIQPIDEKALIWARQIEQAD